MVKMIQKPIKDKFVYKKYRTMKKHVDKKTGDVKMIEVYPYAKYMIKNSAKIIETNQVSKNLYQIKTSKPIYDFATNTLLGVQVLSMSNRIMNEVMCTAEDLGIRIFYQDTDSMHIDMNRLNELATEYKSRFGRELIGKNLGQFHNDFDEVADGYAYKSIFCGKKVYIDMLENKAGEHGVHYRLKGVSLNTVSKVAKDHYSGDLFELYHDMYNGKKINFNLLSTGPRFKNTKNRTVISCNKFERGIRFKQEIKRNVVNC